MKSGFWSKLNKPFVALAPMADVTDAAFRRMFAKYGKPDVMWTEFVSADGLILGGEKARVALSPDLQYSEEERPIVAQLFTARPEVMKESAQYIRSLGFDGIDINMGCPVKTIEKQGAGASLMKNPERAIEVVLAAKEGGGGLPVSVKTRIGYNQNELSSWLPKLLEAEPAAITIHARTRKDMSKVAARWECVQEAVRIRDAQKSSTLIIGNGDVPDVRMVNEYSEKYGCDGVMMGRAIFGNPYAFNPGIRMEDRSPTEKMNLLLEHVQLFQELLPQKNIYIMKKHMKSYLNGWVGAKEIRDTLMSAQTADEIISHLRTQLSHYS